MFKFFFIIFLMLLLTLSFFVFFKKNREDFTTPTAVNLPLDKNKTFFVGNKFPKKPEKPIVEPTGRFQFRKPKLLYDGVWGDHCKIDGNGNETCNWKVESSYLPLDKNNFTYGTDNFLHLPLKSKPIGIEIVSVPDCSEGAQTGVGLSYLEAYEENPPFYLDTPSVEDVLGYNPVDNNLLFPFPKPVVGTF